MSSMPTSNRERRCLAVQQQSQPVGVRAFASPTLDRLSAISSGAECWCVRRGVRGIGARANAATRRGGRFKRRAELVAADRQSHRDQAAVVAGPVLRRTTSAPIRAVVRCNEREGTSDECVCVTRRSAEARSAARQAEGCRGATADGSADFRREQGAIRLRKRYGAVGAAGR